MYWGPRRPPPPPERPLPFLPPVRSPFAGREGTGSEKGKCNAKTHRFPPGFPIEPTLRKVYRYAYVNTTSKYG